VRRNVLLVDSLLMQNRRQSIALSLVESHHGDVHVVSRRYGRELAWGGYCAWGEIKTTESPVGGV
jgi:hypothetical protein